MNRIEQAWTSSKYKTNTKITTARKEYKCDEYTNHGEMDRMEIFCVEYGDKQDTQLPNDG